MTISTPVWTAYIKRLSAINQKAADEMRKFVQKNGFGDTQALIDYGYGLATKYGEASAALSAEMYDAMAALERAAVPAAIPAETASYNTVAKTVQGVKKQSENADMMANAIGRLVKQAGADTTLQNALRDGAQFAWIPSGDTCAFCLTLASNDWKYASKKTIKNGHAEHIHANCDCTYAVRFNEETTVEGYEPKKYLAMYKNAPLDEWNTPDGKPPAGHEGAEKQTPQNRINAMRRQFYRENRAKILEQKTSAYEKRQELARSAAEEFDA